jgi:hypothetical protein
VAERRPVPVAGHVAIARALTPAVVERPPVPAAVHVAFARALAVLAEAYLAECEQDAQGS